MARQEVPPVDGGARVIQNVNEAGRALREGKLLAFPTETVYGLGANAYDEAAVRRIFQVKGRPLTDPLIAHVADTAGAWAIFSCKGEGAEGELLKALGTHFWPGPLTLVAPAAEAIPPAVTAGTGWVGVRCPRHPLARELIAEAGVPVVAPSANRFGHVSPTSSAHVLADLGEHDIYVLHEGAGADGVAEGAVGRVCDIGIESTVAKVDFEAQTITILRAGAVTPSDLSACLSSTRFSQLRITSLSRTPPQAVAEDDSTPQMAPGQCIRHYAPDAPTFLLAQGDSRAEWAARLARTAVVLDVGGRLAALKGKCRAYRDLGSGGDVRAAAAELFDGLRWAEAQVHETQAASVLLAELGGEALEALNRGEGTEGASEREFALAVADRLMRAASGRVATEDTLREVEDGSGSQS